MITCFRIAVREAYRLASRKRFVVMALIVPVGYALFFSALYCQKKFTHIPAVIVDQDRSALSRDITRSIAASETFQVIGHNERVDDFRVQAARGEAHCCFIFPVNFERDVKSGRGGTVGVWVDLSSLLVGNLVVNAASTVIGTYSAGIDVRKSLLRGTTSPGTAAWTALPIQDEYRTWYNPGFNYNYANFMVMGLTTVAIQLLALLLMAGSLATEVEEGTVAELKRLTRNPITVIVGKSLVYWAIITPSCLLAVVAPFQLIDAPMRGSMWLLYGLTAWFVAILVLFGMGISGLIRNSLQSAEICALIAMPSFLLSGFTWPTFAMPPPMQHISYSLPLTNYAFIVRKVTMMGAQWQHLGAQINGMAIWSALAAGLAVSGVTLVLRTRATRETGA